MAKARITVIGAGLMGHGIAQVFALAGHDVTIYDSVAASLDSAKARIVANLRDLGDDQSAVERVRPCGELDEAVRDADYVVEAVLEGSGLHPLMGTVVTADDVAEGKPDPEGYLIALHLLGVEPAVAAAVEDSPAGIAAAKAAGLYTVGVTTTQPAERLAEADEVASGVDRDLIARLLSFA